MASYNIPNRPAGTDPRSIADILGNFDYITGLTEDLAEGSGFDAGAIFNALNLNNEILYSATTGTAVLTGSGDWVSICQISDIPKGIYLVFGNAKYRDSGTSAHSASSKIVSTAGTIEFTPGEIPTPFPRQNDMQFNQSGLSVLQIQIPISTFTVAKITSSTGGLGLSGSGVASSNMDGGLLYFGLKA